MVISQEEERRRVSRELHDEAGQALISLRFSLNSLNSELPEDLTDARRRISAIIEEATRAFRSVRDLAHSLRPPILDVVGLNLGLQEFCTEFSNCTQFQVDYQGVELPDLPDDISITLFRCVQEALTNVVKHAHADRVKVELGYDHHLITVLVKDNGQGFNAGARQTGIGLKGLEERLTYLGGRLEIKTSKGKGVKVTAWVPFEKGKQVSDAE